MAPIDYARATDEELVGLVASGDDGALTTLYDRFGRIGYALALRILRDPGGAEEVVQEVFLKVWRRPDSYRPERGTFVAWLTSVVHHRAIDELRQRQRAPVVVDPQNESVVEPVVDDDIVELAWLSERRAAVRSALAALPAAQRSALELAYFGGLSHREIATRSGEALGTVKTRIRLGMHKLRSILPQMGVVESDNGTANAVVGVKTQDALVNRHEYAD